jgi:hypothetical protein
MPSALHIIRKSNDTKALECIKAQAKDETVTLLLMQEAIYTKPPLGIEMYLLTDDPGKTDIQSGIQPISYDDMLKLLFTHDTVVVW